MAWTELARWLGLPLVVGMAGQIAVALFETTFALHARTNLGMGLVEIGAVFMVCGLLMLVAQLTVIAPLARRLGEAHLASVALVVMGPSLVLMAGARATASVFALVALFAIGMALLTPAVSALVSRRGAAHTGASLGLDSGTKSLGQIAGAILGGVLFGSSVTVPFWLAGGLLLVLAPIFAWSGRHAHAPSRARGAKGSLPFRDVRGGAP